MTKQEVAEECGYEVINGYVELASTCDIFTKKEDVKFKEYWYNLETEMFFENTKEGLNKLCEFEENKRKHK